MKVNRFGYAFLAFETISRNFQGFCRELSVVRS